MQLSEAFIKAIRMYWEESEEFDELKTSKGERKYPKKYFDSLEEEFLPKKDKEKEEKKKKVYG